MNRFQLVLIGLAVLIGVITVLLNRPDDRSVSDQATDTVFSIEGARDPALIDGHLVYEDLIAGDFVRRNLSNDSQERWPRSTPILTARWSPNGQSVAYLAAGENGGWRVLDTQTNQTAQLLPQIRTLTWNTTGDRLAYVYIGDEVGDFRLTIAQSNGTNWQTLFALPTGHGLTDLWWSPLGTFMVGLDTTTDPARYVRIFVSSKRIETLAEGSGDLRWSSSGKRALLDGTEGVVVADVTTGKVEPLGASSRVNWLIWEDEDTLLGVITDESNQISVSRIELADRSVQPIGESPTTPIDQVLGIHDGLAYVQTGTTITAVPIK